MGASSFDGARKQIARLREDGIPKRDRMTVINNGGSCQTTLMCEAMIQSGIEPGDRLTQWYLPSDDLLVIDLGSVDHDLDDGGD